MNVVRTKSIKVNARPHYFARPARKPTGRALEIIPHLFEIVELRENDENVICRLSNRWGNRLQELLKRGIPYDDARRVFYEMDG